MSTKSKQGPEDGWGRYYVKSSGALTRDISVFRDDSYEEQLFKVDGNMLKRDAAILDEFGTVVMKIFTKKTIPMQLDYSDADGKLVANLDTDSPLKKKYMAVDLVDGREWTVEGDHLKQTYSIFDDEQPIAQLDVGSLLIHKKFSFDIVDSDVDMPLAIGVIWAINLAHLQRIGGAGGAMAAV